MDQAEPHSIEVAVIGASGFVGSAVVQALEVRGVRVRGMHAPRLPAMAIEDIGSFLESDSAYLADLSRELAGVVAVVNAAGIADAGSRSRNELLSANAALPGLIARSAKLAGVARLVHVSSAAVQGHKAELDSSGVVQPFSPYSLSKSVGERMALNCFSGVVIYRPTGVHGPGRHVTAVLARIARSPLAMVAAPGDQLTPLALIGNVADAIAFLATCHQQPPEIVAHPSEGLTTAGLIVALGHRRPLLLPVALSRAVGFLLRALARAVPPLRSTVRRAELLLFGQHQADSWLSTSGWRPPVGLVGWSALGREFKRQSPR